MLKSNYWFTIVFIIFTGLILIGCPDPEPTASRPKDSDNDGVPDFMDKCEGHNDNDDDDRDLVPNGCDECEGHDDNIDTDGDLVPDGCDECEGDDNADWDADGVPDGCDECYGDDNIDEDGDGVPDACDNCPDIYNEDQADADNNGIGDACEDNQTDPTFCDDERVLASKNFSYVFLDFEVCGSLTDQVSELPVKYSAKDHPDKDRVKNHTSTYAFGAWVLEDLSGDHQIGFGDTWPANGLPNSTPEYQSFANGFESGDVSAWSTSQGGLPKLLSSALNISENSLVFINAMHENIPENDPTNYYQYGFVFDRDGDPTNNYQPHPDFPNDFFKDTDFWVVAWYDPINGWELVVTDASNGTFVQVASEAQLIFVNNTMILIIPQSEFFTNDIGYRMTAFRHTGDWGINGDWNGDVQPPVADGLRSFNY